MERSPSLYKETWARKSCAGNINIFSSMSCIKCDKSRFENAFVYSKDLKDLNSTQLRLGSALQNFTWKQFLRYWK